MRVINKLYVEWPPEIRKKLRSLTLRSFGSMCKAVSSKKCDTFAIFKGDVVVGWGIYVLEPWYRKDISGDFMLYVRKSYRRLGVGRYVIRAALRKYNRLMVHVWDKRSGKFYRELIYKDGLNLDIARGRHFLEVYNMFS